VKTRAERRALRKRTCRHFRGTVNAECAAGIVYESLTDGAPGWARRLPCFGDAGAAVCAQYSALTDAEFAEADRGARAAMERLEKLAPRVAEIRKEYAGRDVRLVETCPACGKRIALEHHGANGHVWAACETPGCIGFME